MAVKVINHRANIPADGTTIDVTSYSETWSQLLSPVYLSSIELYDNNISKTFENAWQYCKVYPQYAKDGEPTAEYYTWAKAGWARMGAVRYPLGRSARPLYSIFSGEKFGYIQARKNIYCRLYAAAVEDSPAWFKLEEVYQTCKESDTTLYLRDHDCDKHYFSYNNVLNNSDKKMGHAFVLAMMLEGQRLWE